MGIFDKKENVMRVNENEMEDIGVTTHYKGKPFTGIAFASDDNGFVYIESEMLEGLKHGKQTEYHDDDDYWINYYENDLKIGHDNNTYDKITNEVFPNKKYNNLEEILKKIQDKIKFLEIMDDVMAAQGHNKQNSESYYHTLGEEMMASLLRQKKLSENVYDQAEERSNKDNDNCERTLKFTDELKKYVKSHNDNAVIYVYPSKYGVHEEFIHKGQWENKDFTMKISIPLKSPDFNFNGNLNDLIQQLGTKKITQLDEKFYDWLDFLGDGGGSWQIDEIIWEEKLSKEEEKKFNQSEFLSRWLDEGMQSVEDKMVFEKGCIEEIKVTIDDEIIKLVI